MCFDRDETDDKMIIGARGGGAGTMIVGQTPAIGLVATEMMGRHQHPLLPVLARQALVLTHFIHHMAVQVTRPATEIAEIAEILETKERIGILEILGILETAEISEKVETAEMDPIDQTSIGTEISLSLEPVLVQEIIETLVAVTPAVQAQTKTTYFMAEI